ncbi:ATP-dependent DNA helicase PIF1 [Lentinula edodes]|uniref:ATP-dependent DNA helicase n=1 Tax=Lentinula edodes TaxID=5353 RepID=A0A1Q3E514_LENED|nr:ATP-dependent DNA helicase PIF1 [Lentinula edodes]
MWLVGAPNPSEMREALKSAEFRAKVVTFISSTMRADVGKTLPELMAIKAQPSIAYQRPISPDDPQYEAKRLQQEIILARTLQFHECSPERCYKLIKGVMRCKRRAPWPTSEFDYIDEDGTWRMKRTVGYLNGFNPTILETQLCNNDQKLVTNGDETQDMTYYITTYSTKKRDRSTNESAILAQRLAYHREQERKNSDVAEASRKLVMRCATALNRNQELSAPEVISYLMGWGDRYISHTFAPIYLEGIVSFLRRYYVSLQEKRWARVATGDGGCEVVQVSDNTAAEVEEIRLTMVSGEVETRTQLDDYCHRGETLEHYNLKDFFADTYDKFEKGADGVVADNRTNTIRAGRIPGIRHQYLPSKKPNHVRLVRQEGHETVPLYVGRWFPRNDRPEDRVLYILLMLAILKPWREITDITKGFQTLEEVWSDFTEHCSDRTQDFIANVQYFYRCSDQSAARREKEYQSYVSPEVAGEETEMMIQDRVVGDDVPVGPDVASDEEIYKAQDREGMAQELYAYTAMESAYDAGVFEREFQAVSVAPIAGRCTLEERVDFQDWHKELLEYTSSGGRLVVNDIDMEHNLGQVVANAPPIASVERENIPDGVDRSGGVGRGLRDILNEEQARAHDIVVEHLQKTIAGEGPAQLLLLLQGPGGTGKTVVINAISETFERLGVKGYLAKTATTGVAASHFGGKTLHTWAGIKVGARAGEDLISNASIAIQRRRMANIGPARYLILDECSMATKELIGRTSTICTHVATVENKPNCDQYFGGMNVILCGDFHQYPPVGNGHGALYEPNSAGANSYSILGRHIYSEFNKTVTLKQQIRVKDERWMQLLSRLRTGSCNGDDLEELRKLRLDIESNPQTDFTEPGWNTAVLITPRNSVRRKWNKAAVRRHCKQKNQRLYSCPAEDTIAGESLTSGQLLRLAKFDTKRTGNLAHRVEIAVGMSAMVLANISTEADLANGTRGTVTHIILDDREPVEHEERDGATMLRYPPACIFFKPDGDTAVRLKGCPEGLLPIVPQEAKFSVPVNETGSRTITRRQLALTPGYAFTDLKSQGQTIEYVIVDLASPNYGSKLNAFGAYVSLSRSRGRDTIRILRGFDESIFVTHPSQVLEAEDEKLIGYEQATTRAWREGNLWALGQR